MAKTRSNGWKTCSRGHKYRGDYCPKCWKGAHKNMKGGRR